MHIAEGVGLVFACCSGLIMMEVLVCTGEVLSGTSEVAVELRREGVSCGELLEDLLRECGLDPSRRGEWLLEEEWHGCSKHSHYAPSHSTFIYVCRACSMWD